MGSPSSLLLCAGVDPLDGKRRLEFLLVQLPFRKHFKQINAAIWLNYVTSGGRLALCVIRKKVLPTLRNPLAWFRLAFSEKRTTDLSLPLISSRLIPVCVNWAAG